MKKFLASLIVWTFVLGGGGAAYKYLVLEAGINGGQPGIQVASNSPTSKPSNPVVPPTSKPIVPPTTKPKEPPPSNLPKITLALDAFSGYHIFRSPEFKAKLTAKGFDFEAKDDAADYTKRMGTVKSGETPLAVFTIDSLLGQTDYDKTPPAVMVMLLDETRGADAMIAYKDGIKDVASLNDPNVKLVMVPDSPSEALSRVVRAKFSLPNLPTDKKTFLIDKKSPDEVYSTFLNAKPTDKTAYVLWEPYVTMALTEKKAAGAHLLIDSSKFSGYIVDVLVVQREYLAQHRDRVTTVARAYLETLHEFNQKNEVIDQVLADFKRLGEDKMTRENAAQVVKGVRWKNTVENYGHFGVDQGAGLQTIDDMIRNITVVLEQTKQKGEPTQGVSRSDKLWDNSILKELYTQKPGGLHIGYQTITIDVVSVTLTAAEWNTLIPVGTIKIPPIPFTRTDKLDMDAGADVALKETAAALREWKDYYFRIEGDVMKNPSDINDADKNKARLRADLVVKYLTDELKVPADRLKADAVVTGRAREVRAVALQKP